MNDCTPPPEQKSDLLAAHPRFGLRGSIATKEACDAASHLVRLVDLAYRVIEHSGEHYGQLVAYYRISGMVPPESREK